MSSYPLFTIIVSGYQNEPFLPQCLASISGQTFGEFEVICYVEESTDNSLAICQEWATQDARFTVVIGQKSGSASATRNYGIEHATGEYLVVIDGDDWVSPDMLAKLAAKLERCGQVDICAFAAVTTKEDEVDWKNSPRLTNFTSDDQSEVFSGWEAIRRTGRNGCRFNAQTWLSIYRTVFLRENQLYQHPGIVMQDFEWTPRVWFLASRFAYMDENFYCYRLNPSSISHTAKSRHAHDFTTCLQLLLSFLKSRQVPEDILAIWGNQWLNVTIQNPSWSFNPTLFLRNSR